MVLLSLPKTLLILHASTHSSSLQNYDVVKLILYVIMYYILYNRHQILNLNCADEVTHNQGQQLAQVRSEMCLPRSYSMLNHIYAHADTHAHSH